MATHKAPKLRLVKTTVAPVARPAAKVAARPKSKVSAKPRAKETPKAVIKPAAKPVAKAPPRARALPPVKAAGKPAAKTANKKAKNKQAAVNKVVKPQTATPALRLFQIYYRPEQRAQLDPAFEPYNNEGERSPLLEYNVFRKLAASDLTKGAALWGALSWKFSEKTGLSGAQLREVIAKNPGFDVYYCNPFPELEGLYHNLWLQGETVHPNFLILCRDFFQAAGLDESALEELQPSAMFASSNYFVATPAFWQQYLDFMDSTLAKAEKNMSSTAKAMIYSSAADMRGLHSGANYLPFIIERLFGYFIARHKQGVKTYKYAVVQEQGRLNVHQKLLSQVKDVAVNAKSLWMASCWVNYRSLYLQQAYGKEWCQRYLMSVTPQKFVLMVPLPTPKLSTKTLAIEQEKA